MTTLSQPLTLNRLWAHRRQAFYTPLMAVGLWRLREDGGYYQDGYVEWRFWRPLTVGARYDGAGELAWPFLGFLAGWPCR